MLAINGQTAGPNWRTFLKGTHRHPACTGGYNIGKKLDFFSENSKYYLFKIRNFIYLKFEISFLTGNAIYSKRVPWTPWKNRPLIVNDCFYNFWTEFLLRPPIVRKINELFLNFYSGRKKPKPLSIKMFWNVY